MKLWETIAELIIKNLDDGLKTCPCTCPHIEYCEKHDLICFNAIQDILEVKRG